MMAHPRETIHACVAFALAAIVVSGASPVGAQIPPALADPRPDPLLLMPVVTTDTQLRVAGVVMTPVKSARNSITPALVGTTPTVMGRLTMFLPDGTPLSFPVAFQSVPDPLGPHRTGFMGIIKTSELIGEVPTNTGAILTLDCTNCPRGSRLGADVYVEEISPIQQRPSFVPYFVGLVDAKTDGVVDPKTDPVIDQKTDPVVDPKVDSTVDPRTDGLVLMPLITAQSQLRVTGVVHLRRRFRDPDTLGLVGETPTVHGRLTLFLADGTSQALEIQFQTIEEKGMPRRLGFTGVGALSSPSSQNLVGDTPAIAGAALAFDCVGCSPGARINVGVYVEETSATPRPSFVPYFVGVTELKADPAVETKTDG